MVDLLYHDYCNDNVYCIHTLALVCCVLNALLHVQSIVTCQNKLHTGSMTGFITP